MSENEEKKAQKALEHVQNDMEQLQKVIKQTNTPGQEVFIEHMTGKNGILRPLGLMLNSLLDDPIVKQAIGSKLPDTNKKH